MCNKLVDDTSDIVHFYKRIPIRTNTLPSFPTVHEAHFYHQSTCPYPHQQGGYPHLILREGGRRGMPLKNPEGGEGGHLFRAMGGAPHGIRGVGTPPFAQETEAVNVEPSVARHKTKRGAGTPTLSLRGMGIPPYPPVLHPHPLSFAWNSRRSPLFSRPVSDRGDTPHSR